MFEIGISPVVGVGCAEAKFLAVRGVGAMVAVRGVPLEAMLAVRGVALIMLAVRGVVEGMPLAVIGVG